MKRCPACGAEVPPSNGPRPRKFCSDPCRVRLSELRRALRERLTHERQERERLAALAAVGQGWGGRPAGPEIERVDERIGELQSELARLEV